MYGFRRLSLRQKKNARVVSHTNLHIFKGGTAFAPPPHVFTPLLDDTYCFHLGVASGEPSSYAWLRLRHDPDSAPAPISAPAPAPIRTLAAAPIRTLAATPTPACAAVCSGGGYRVTVAQFSWSYPGSVPAQRLRRPGGRDRGEHVTAAPRPDVRR